MGYTYTPTYYSSFQDSIASLCKTILPFSFKKRPLLAAEQKLQKQQSDNLKWQQNSFHQILNLTGLHKEGILPETEVASFRSRLLETLIVSQPGQEQPAILRDKLLFLQELLYAKCISAEEYHASKRPLLQRLALQGAEIDARDLIVGSASNGSSDEEWSVIDLRDEQCLLNKGDSCSKDKSKQASAAIRHIKGAASVFGFGSSQKQGKNREEKSIFDLPGINNQNPVSPNIPEDENAHLGENPFWDDRLKEKHTDTKSILMSETIVPESDRYGRKSGGADNSNKVKRDAFLGIFHKEQKEGHGVDNKLEGDSTSSGKHWGFDGFKKWKRSSNMEDERALPFGERSEIEAYYMGTSNLDGKRIREGPVTKQIKRKLHAAGYASEFSIDKVPGEKIKRELSRIQNELSSTNPNLKISNGQMEAISTKFPVDIPKSSWRDHQYGDVVKKEFKGHVGEMEHVKSMMRWATFEDEENFHPNLFAARVLTNGSSSSGSHSSSVKSFGNISFFHDQNENNMTAKNQNPFWIPGS
ncbi:hypothetical protein Nepgr_006446 [Nepenthes gracilis]|uniref:Uncharacterized protein n=1 Tax=Nepenthes gracilis TaxID=150966 RepID=A0AAD3XHL7_NEPGR|nr:hypothetical protein Nepgr_006446 [Nepenthes gracilis]